MSFCYSRVRTRPVPIKMYGFKKISPQDLNHVVMRLQKRSYHTDQDNNTQHRKTNINSTGRPLSSICRKADLDNNEAYRRRPRTALTPLMLYRLNRRLQRSTISRRAAQGLITPSYEPQDDQHSVGSDDSFVERPRTAKEREKALTRIQRPTTASKRREPCCLHKEEQESSTAEYDYSNEYFAPEDEIDEIVERLTVATVASRGREGEDAMCDKTGRIREYQRYNNNLPLISGLERSRGVKEITQRLYKPCRRTPAATRTTTYQ